MWILLVGNVIFWSAFWIWRERGRVPAVNYEPQLFQVILWILVGWFFLVVGAASYILCVFTACLTFDFKRRVWSVVKRKLFVANILVPLAASLGVGFGLSAFLTPVLKAEGMETGMASVMPVMGAVMLLQIAQMWVLIWAPLEKRLIERRLLARCSPSRKATVGLSAQEAMHLSPALSAEFSRSPVPAAIVAAKKHAAPPI